ncbi:MAG: dual specificity protein phosphatase family protein, partial [Chloroflexota bacterium]
RPWLIIGKYRETIQLPLLKQYNVGALLHLADDVQHPGIESLSIVIDDGTTVKPEHIGQGVDFVREQKAAGKVVMVACGAGISRSSSFAIAALKEEEALSLKDALVAVKTAHPPALPHMALWQSLCDYYGEDIPYNSIWRYLHSR